MSERSQRNLMPRPQEVLEMSRLPTPVICVVTVGRAR